MSRCLRSIVFVAIFWIATMGFVAQAEESVKVREQLDFAQGLLNRGMYDMALVQCQKFITDYPQSSLLPQAYLSLGEGYFLSEDFKNAAKVFNQLKNLFPKVPQLEAAALRLAQMDIQQKAYDQALQELGYADGHKDLKLAVQVSFDFYKGLAYKGLGDKDHALLFFKQAAQVQGIKDYTADAFKEIGLIYAQEKQYGQALNAYTASLQVAQENGLRAELSYRIAEIHFLSEQYTQAIDGFNKVLDDYPHGALAQDALTNLFAAYLNVGQYDLILKQQIVRAAQIHDDESYFPVHRTVVLACLELKRYDQAKILLERMAHFKNLEPQERDFIFLKEADMGIQEGRYPEGLAALDKVDRTDLVSSEETLFLKARAEYGLGDFDHAFNFFENLSLNYPQSRFSKAALLGQAHARQAVGRFKESELLFLKYYALEDDADLKSEALYDALMMGVKAKDGLGAIKSAQDYLKSFPHGARYSAVVLVLAEEYAAHQQFNQALDLLRAYLKSPASTAMSNGAYFLLGLNEERLGLKDQALADYAKVDEHQEQADFYAAAIKNMAIIYLAEGTTDQAKIYFDRLISLPGNNALQIKTYIWICNEYLKHKAFEDVLRIAQAAAKHFSESDPLEIEYFQAEALRGLGRYSEAVRHYQRVRASGLKNVYTASAAIGYGLCLVQNKDFIKAKEAFEQALDEQPDDYTISAHARFEIANVEALQSHWPQALKFYLLIATIYDDKEYGSQSLLASGKILEHLKRKADALKMYTEILNKYKNTQAAVLAQQRVLRLQ